MKITGNEIFLTSNNNQILKYHIHKKKFLVGDNAYINLFEELLEKSNSFELECSCKVVGKIIFPARFNIWYYNNDHIKNINLFLDFLKKISEFDEITINYDIFNKIYNKNLKLDKIHRVIVGIDYREYLIDSRLKIWFIIKNYPKMFNQVLSIYGINDKTSDLIINDELLFGVDFYLSGKTNIKIYFYYNEKQLKTERIIKSLKELFSVEIFKLIKICNGLHISFAKEDLVKILHFHIKNYNNFIFLLKCEKIEKLKEIIARNTQTNGLVISLYENEIANEIKRFNLYY